MSVRNIDDQIDLELNPREARCLCGRTERSTATLAFFVDRNTGSKFATDLCRCGYHRVAHGKPHIKCKKFVQRGAHDYDEFYCGCRGWD